ncbi:unnamed protein product [Urochloa humidicola]
MSHLQAQPAVATTAQPVTFLSHSHSTKSERKVKQSNRDIDSELLAATSKRLHASLFTAPVLTTPPITATVKASMSSLAFAAACLPPLHYQSCAHVCSELNRSKYKGATNDTTALFVNHI